MTNLFIPILKHFIKVLTGKIAFIAFVRLFVIIIFQNFPEILYSLLKVLKLVICYFFYNYQLLKLKIALVFEPKVKKAILECQR